MAIEHIKTVHYSSVHIYTDGAKNPELGITGAAFYVPELKYGNKGRLTNGASVYTAELVAIQMALQWIEETRMVSVEEVLICSDSMASLLSLQTFKSCRNDILTEVFISLYRLKNEGILVRFVWVPAHVGIQGNEMVDQMAKEALQLNNINLTVSLSRVEGKSLINQACKDMWQISWDSCMKGRHFYNIQGKLKQSNINHNISRREYIIFTRLRMGHTSLNANNYIIGKHNTGLCDGCQERETVEHVLMTCVKYQQERILYIREVQEMGITEFTMGNILNEGTYMGRLIRALMRFLKNIAVIHRI